MMLPQKLHVRASPRPMIPVWRGRPRPRLASLTAPANSAALLLHPQIGFNTALPAACGNLIGTKYSCR